LVVASLYNPASSSRKSRAVTPEQWPWAKKLLAEALQRPVAERDAFLADACREDAALHAELRAVLEQSHDVVPAPAVWPHGEGAGADPSTTITAAGSVRPKTIGPYVIERQIGRGGMGHVYLAYDDRLHRRVAIKTLVRESGGSTSAEHLILREARAIARLSHPNIASVFDVIEQDGRAHIVMELLDGETLASRLARGPLSIDDVLHYAIQMATGLGHAHAQSIVHCDFKPANVFILPDGTVKLLDFGLARVIDAGVGGEQTHVGASPTLVRQRAGTPAYMSPEHRDGHPLDARSDVYSLGIVIHEMATGRRPPPTLSSRRGSDDRARLIDASLAPILRDVTATALAPDPADRFESGSAMAAELRAVAAAHHARANGWLWRAALGLVAVSVLAGASYWVWRDRPRTMDRAPTTRPIVAVLPFVAEGSDPATGYLAAGLAEIVTNELAASPELVVVSPASVRAAGDRPAPAHAATALGATHVVSASVRSEGPQLHISMQLFTRASNAATPLGTLDTTFAEVAARRQMLGELVRRRFREDGVLLSPPPAQASNLPTDARSLEEYARGREYLQRSDAEPNLGIALNLFESAAQRDPQFALAHAAVSEACWRKYRRTRDAAWATRAQVAAFEAMRLAPEEAQVRYSAAVVLYGTGRSREAIDEVTRALALQPTSDDAHRLRARLHADAGELEAAIAEFRTAIELRPGAWEGYHALGEVYFDNGRYRDAIEAFAREAQLRPDSATPFQSLGTAYHANGDLERAVENYQRAIAIAPSANAYSNIGMIHYSQGRFDEAVRAYERSAAIAPGEPITHRNLGDALTKARRAGAARASYRRAIELAAQDLVVNPRRASLLTLQGICHAQLGERAKARAAIEAALTIAPNDNQVLYQAAVAVALLRQPDEAMRLLARAIEAGYAWQLAADDEDLGALRDRREFKALAPASPPRP
jgi:eukaryotic-like serine/threonine-protein kinase